MLSRAADPASGSDETTILKGNDRAWWPEDGACPVCGSRISGDFAYVSGGALRMDLSGLNSIDSRRLRAFLDIGFHTHGESPGPVNVPLVDDLAGGQFDLQFCSTACLRQWLNRLIDRIESDSKNTETQRELTREAGRWIEQGLTDGSIERRDEAPTPADAGGTPGGDDDTRHKPG